MVRTRVAPSPTGYPHIGTVDQVLFDYSYAKKNNGSFIVRIEDTDRKRFVEGSEDKIYEALDWFGLTENESPRKDGPFGPYRQSERLPVYKKYAMGLIEKEYAYYCFCTPNRLEEMRNKLQAEKQPVIYDKNCRNIPKEEAEKRIKNGENYVIRLKVPENTKIVVKDELRGDVVFDSNLIDDQVIIKSDGFPTYHLAVVVDDHLMEITHVVRAEEWLPSAPKHFLLYDYFDWEKPLFYHTPDLRNPDRSKLSKRQGHTNVSWYQEQGYLPEALLNFLALLGWSHPEGKEIFSLDEFIKLFDLKDINPIGPIFDLNKLNWINGVYIRNLGVKELSQELRDFAKIYYKDILENKMFRDEIIFEKIVALAQTRFNTLKDFFVLTKVIFMINKLTFENKDHKSIIEDLVNGLLSIKDWNKENIFKILKETMIKHTIKMPVLYKIFTGEEKGLPLPETLEILGKEETLNRLKDM